MSYQVNIAVNSLTINSKKTWVGQASFTYTNTSKGMSTSGGIEPFAIPAAFNFGVAGQIGPNHVEYMFATTTNFLANIDGNTSQVSGTLSLVGATYGSDPSGGSEPVVTSPTYAHAVVGANNTNSVTVACPGGMVTCTQLHFMFTWTESLTAYTYTVYFRSADPRSTNIGSGDPLDLQNPQTTNDSSAPTHL